MLGVSLRVLHITLGACLEQRLFEQDIVDGFVDILLSVIESELGFHEVQ